MGLMDDCKALLDEATAKTLDCGRHEERLEDDLLNIQIENDKW